ncbi:MAG: hypothetical protein KAW41_04605 [Candidatus Diapherotrites archaeon]|nr:hypothetical protein [Candidatus Diapherotrites archaeon]
MGLVHVFGDRPIPKVLDFLRVHSEWDYSLKDIGGATGVSFRTLQRVMPELVEGGIAKKTRTEGRAQMYQFNKESAIAVKLDELATAVDMEFLEEHAKQKAKIRA